MPTLVTIIATRDEAVHIRRAVASVRGLGPVYVVDSGSTDGTEELARDAGATVVHHAWEGYAAQKNWAREALATDADWVLHLDADEFLTPALRAEIERVVSAPSAHGYYIARENVFLGRVLRHAWWYPDFQLRLFRPSKGTYEDRVVHEHVLLEGAPGFLEHPLIHENLKGIDAFVGRHLKYAALEVAEMHREREGSGTGELRRGRILGSWPERRRALKLLVWYRMPARPLVRFVWLYVVKRGFLDGREGLVYCQLLSTYDVFTDAKDLEIQRERLSPAQLGCSAENPKGALACPRCRASLAWTGAAASCNGCGQEFAAPKGVTDFRAKPVELHQKVVAEPEPRGRRLPFDPALAGFEGALAGSTAVTTGAGASARARTLARAGATVVAVCDSQEEALAGESLAAKETLAIVHVVGDSTALPFDDGAIDMAFHRDEDSSLASLAPEMSELLRVSQRLAVACRRTRKPEEAASRRFFADHGWEIVDFTPYVKKAPQLPPGLAMLFARNQAVRAIRVVPSGSNQA